MSRVELRSFVCCTLVLALFPIACVTRGVPTSEETLAELRSVVHAGPTPPQVVVAGSDADTNDYYLHASGRVRCDGWLYKRQTAYFTAWTTHPGPAGEIVDVAEISARFDYRDGLFAGAHHKTLATLAEEVTLHETISGFGDICSCIYAVGKASLLRSRLEVKETICPE